MPAGLPKAAPPPPPPKLTMTAPFSCARGAASNISCAEVPPATFPSGACCALDLRVAALLTARRGPVLALYAPVKEAQTHMNERIDETKGNIKEGFGKLTGDRETEAEGRAEHDTA